MDTVLSGLDNVTSVPALQRMHSNASVLMASGSVRKDNGTLKHLTNVVIMTGQDTPDIL